MKPLSRSAMFILPALSLTCVPQVNADTTFTPRAFVSIASYEFTQSARPGALAPSGINGNTFPEVNFDVTFRIFGLGGTFISNAYYLDLLLQNSLDEEDSFSMTDPNIALPDNTFTEVFKGDRRDGAITFGRKFDDNRAAIYIGYKTGESQATGNQGERLRFEEDGLFIGINYAWVLPRGALSVNLAFADLDGKLQESVTNPAFSGLAAPLDTNANSDAQGLSYGVTWSSRLTNTLSYSLGLDARRYSFENVTDSNPSAIPSDEFEEAFVSATFSLYFLF